MPELTDPRWHEIVMLSLPIVPEVGSYQLIGRVACVRKLTASGEYSKWLRPSRHRTIPLRLRADLCGLAPPANFLGLTQYPRLGQNPFRPPV
jgi:hypothetical protein